MEGNTGFGAIFGAEIFVFGEFVEPKHLRADERLVVDAAAALGADETVGAGIGDGGGGAGINGEFLGGEVLFLIDLAVDDPAIDITLFASVSDGDGFEVMVVLEVRIDVFVPIKLIDDEVDVLMLFFGHVFDEEAPRHFAAFDEALIHAKDIAAPLRFVGAEAAGGVENTGVDEPAGAGFEAVGFGEIEDAVVSLVPVGDALADFVARGAGLKSHESVGEVIADVVVLGREVVGFRFAFLTHEGGLGGALVHVMGNRPHVIEEFGVDGPFPVFFPDALTDQGGATGVDGVAQGEALIADDTVTEAFIGDAAFIGGLGGGGEPAFVDTTSVQTVGVGVAGMQLDAETGLQKGARDPGGSQAKQATGIFQSGFDMRFNGGGEGRNCLLYTSPSPRDRG